jgi:Immunoglobulin-like domain of bacterial spore germination
METTYTDPETAAREFALSIGYADPVTGEFRAGDSRSGEVELRAADNTPPSVVFVRQLDDRGSWYVIGAATENIDVATPETLEVITSPLEVAGTALAFEGTVDVVLTADDQDDPLVESFVTGSGGPEPGPFEGSFEFESPDADGGALMFLSRSSEDGSVLEVTALRVFFDDAG